MKQIATGFIRFFGVILIVAGLAAGVVMYANGMSLWASVAAAMVGVLAGCGALGE